MSEPPTTDQLSEISALAVRQAADLHAHLEELACLVALTGMELPPATRREVHTELHAAVGALYAVQLSVFEPRRGTPADP